MEAASKEASDAVKAAIPGSVDTSKTNDSTDFVSWIASAKDAKDKLIFTSDSTAIRELADALKPTGITPETDSGTFDAGKKTETFKVDDQGWYFITDTYVDSDGATVSAVNKLVGTTYTSADGTTTYNRSRA
ncbi:MAG: hypothetical protein LKJ47_07075 [Bifidobacteriaceae bacterium]|jgi:hypothetical protein|nr:hypothetical protein [Bifidobacteriaceae bacterium]